MRLRDRFDRSKRKPSSLPQRIGFALFWLLVLAYGFMIPLGANWNAESHLYLTFAIVDHHSVNIDPYHQRLGDESFYGGHYYTDKAPGLSFLAVPLYAGLRAVNPHTKGQGYGVHSHMRYSIPRSTVYLRYIITYLLIVLPSAIFGVLLWLFLRRFTQSDGWALAIAVVYSLGTIAFVYSTQFFSHQVTAILLFGSFLVMFSRVRMQAPNMTVLGFAALAGLLAGYAVITEYPAAVIAALLAAYCYVVAPGRARALVAFILGLVPAAALNVTYNLLAFGKPFSTGYSYVHSEAYQSQVHAGTLGLANPASYGIRAPSWNSLWQITFGPYRGIFLISPVLLLFFVGVVFLWRRRDLRAEFWLCSLVVILYFLMDASRGVEQNGWSGGWSIASRHLTPMLPFMLLPIALALRIRAFRLAFVALGSASIAMTFMAVAGGDQFSFSDHNPLVNEMLPNFFNGNLIANWGAAFGLRGLASLVPLAVLAAALLSRLLWLLHVKGRRFTLHEPALLVGVPPRGYPEEAG